MQNTEVRTQNNSDFDLIQRHRSPNVLSDLADESDLEMLRGRLHNLSKSPKEHIENSDSRHRQCQEDRQEKQKISKYLLAKKYEAVSNSESEVFSESDSEIDPECEVKNRHYRDPVRRDNKFKKAD